MKRYFDNLLKVIYFLFPFLFLTSCAKKYYPISIENIEYSNNSMNGELEFSYKYNLLDKNEKYKKKGIDKNISLVALSITNNSADTLRIGDELRIYSGNKEANVLLASEVVNELKQSTASYLFYMLLTFSNFYVEENNNRRTYPIGLVIGPSLTAGNMLVSSKANKKMEANILEHYLLNIPIYPGETKNGLIGLRYFDFDPIKIVKEK